MFYVAIVSDFNDGDHLLGAYHDFDMAKEAINEWFGDDYYCEDDARDGNALEISYYEGAGHECVGLGSIYCVDKIV